MDYYRFKVKCVSNLTEIIIAFLGNLPFDSFEENETGFNAYISKNDYSESVDSYLKELSQQFEFQVEKQFVPYQNWNEKWESNFSPIQVGNFCGIRADFHPAFKDIQYSITINPKMAFGTGHHATTFLVMSLMEHLNFTCTKVLDYGCGTGLLSILASQMGAFHVDAVDIDILSYENTLENCQVNSVNNVEAYHGQLDQIVDNDYNFILANINRNVILLSLKELYKKLSKDGILIISGFLKEDEEIMNKACTANMFKMKKVLEKDNWLSFQLEK